MKPQKSEIRLTIEKANLIELLEHNSLKEISKMFNTSIFMVHNALTAQFNKREIGLKLTIDNWEEEQLSLPTDWSFNEIRNFLK